MTRVLYLMTINTLFSFLHQLNKRFFLHVHMNVRPLYSLTVMKLSHSIVPQKRHSVLHPHPEVGIVSTPVDSVCRCSSSRVNCTQTEVKKYKRYPCDCTAPPKAGGESEPSLPLWLHRF